MKAKYLIATLILISFTICLFAQQSDDKHNGYKWEKIKFTYIYGMDSSFLAQLNQEEKNELIKRGEMFQIFYIQGVVNSISSIREFNIHLGILSIPIPAEDITAEEDLNISQQDPSALDVLLSKFDFTNYPSDYWDYSGVTYGQYRDGLDEFYEDYRNMKIPIVLAMRIIKHEVEGTSQKEIDEIIRILREYYSKN